jgi:hypothetical protein
MDNSGAVNDLAMDNCVIDGEDISGRSGFLGQNLGQSFSITGSEFKDILGWAVMDSNSGSGDGGGDLPLTTVTFANNNVHDCNGSVALRGQAGNKTVVVNANGNIFDNLGGNEGELGEHWAALEVNHAVEANVYKNAVSNVHEGMWGEGQAFQFWDIDTLNMYCNDLIDNHQGIFIYGGAAGGTYGGPYAVPGGSISDNNFVGNGQYGISVDPNATAGPLKAKYNWWGYASGPHHPTLNPDGAGDAVSDNVAFSPWLKAEATCEPTAITLASFAAQAGLGSVTLAWETGTEVDNAGFNLYRASAADGPFVKVNSALIAAEGDPVAGASYSFLDKGLESGAYYYKLEDVDLNGVTTLHGPVSATVLPRLRRPSYRPTLP